MRTQHPASPPPLPETANPPEPDLPPTTDVPRAPFTRWIVGHPWVTLAISLAVVALSVFSLSGGIQQTTYLDQMVGTSATAERLRADADFGDKPSEYVAISPRDGAPTADVETVAAGLMTDMRAVDGVGDVLGPIPGKDGASVLVKVEFDVPPTPNDTSASTWAADYAADHVAGTLAVTDAAAAAHPTLRISQTGSATASTEFDEVVGEDFKRAEYQAIPATLIILLVVFGSLVAAGVPLLLGLVSVVTAFGATAVISRFSAVDQNTQSIVLLIGLAVGVDYALFVIRRAREEHHAGRTNRDAVIVATSHAGRAVVISGITVMVAMSGMLVTGGMFASLSVGTLIVVGAAIVFAITTLPALLVLLGDNVEKLRVPFLWRLTTPKAGQPVQTSAWARLARAVTARPWVWAAATVTVLLLLASPLLGMKTAMGGIETLPKELRAVQAHEHFTDVTGGQNADLNVVVKAPAGDQLAVEKALTEEFTTYSADHVQAVVDEPVKVSTDNTVTVLNVGTDLTASAQELPSVVERLRAEFVPAVQDRLSGIDATVVVGGEAAATDLAAWIDSRLPWVVAFVLVITFVVMALSFGSLTLAATTVALNGLSVSAAYGIMTGVFQNTWAEGVLDFTSSGAITAWIPLLMFVILFGLSMDYHIFVTSRIREAYASGVSPREAIVRGIGRSAAVVTGAAAVMVGVFSIFGTLSSLELKQLGVGMAVAVALDATLVRGVALPAVFALLGKRIHHGPHWLPTLHH